MNLYAIQHTPTGNFLPAPKGRGGRGGSHVEPCPATEQVPRFFTMERAAKAYLTIWLQGTVRVHGFQTWEGDYDEDYLVTPEPHRKREEMAVVPVEIVLPSAQ